TRSAPAATATAPSAPAPSVTRASPPSWPTPAWPPSRSSPRPPATPPRWPPTSPASPASALAGRGRIPPVLRPAYPLETARLVLRPFEAGDLEALYAFHSLPEVARFLYWEARDLVQVRAVLDAKVRQGGLEDERQGV